MEPLTKRLRLRLRGRTALRWVVLCARRSAGPYRRSADPGHKIARDSYVSYQIPILQRMRGGLAPSMNLIPRVVPLFFCVAWGGVLLSLHTASPGYAQSETAPSASPEAGAASVDEALARVDSLRQEGAYHAAITALDSLRDVRGDRVDFLWRLTFARTRLGTITEDKDQRNDLYMRALENADAALKLDSTSALAHLSKAVAEGRVALDAGTRERVQRSRAVKEHVDRAIALDSTLAIAYHVRGRWHRKVDDLGFFQKTIVRTVYGGLPDASFEQSIQDFKRAIELEDMMYHHLELAKTYFKLDRDEAGREELHHVLLMPNEDPLDPRHKAEARAMLAGG